MLALYIKKIKNIYILIIFIISNELFSNDLINEFNFSSSLDGLYTLNDGRKFEATTLSGHIKNNLGYYGIIKCSSLIETKKEKLIFLKVICEISLNDNNKIWTVLERNSETFNAGIGRSVIIDATGKFKILIGTECMYAVTKYESSSFVIEKCKLNEKVFDKIKKL